MAKQMAGRLRPDLDPEVVADIFVEAYANTIESRTRNELRGVMKVGRITVSCCLAALTLMLGALVGCRKTAEAQPQTSAAAVASPATPAAAARLSAPVKVRFAPQIVLTGNLKSDQSAQLAVAVAGTLERVPVKRSQRVEQGAVLAVLDSAAARATLTQAQAAVAVADVQLRLAEDALVRMTNIRKEQGISEAQLIQSQGQRDMAAGQLLAAKAQLQQAEVLLRNHTLRAPFAGVVTKVPDGIGMTVSPGVPLVSLESTQALVLVTSVTQEQAPETKLGTKVRLLVPATGARGEDAVVRTVVPSVDSVTNRVPVEIFVPNPDGRFMAHASARAYLPQGAERDAWRVSSAALVQREGSYALWVAGADGKARTISVNLLGQEGDGAVVDPGVDGWPAGARVIDTPPLGLSEGSAVAEVASR